MASQSDLNWDNLRIFLTVIRSRSLRQAAEKLGVSHPTIRRRLEELEKQLGLRLFDRRPDGLHPTPEATELLEKAETVEASVHALGRCADSAAPALEGEIHITSLDMLMSELLAPEIAAFTEKWPKIKLRVETTYELADLGSREADIAFRSVPYGELPNEELIGRKAGSIATAVYGKSHQWIGWGGAKQDHVWIKDFPYADRPILGAFGNIYFQRAAALAGMGMALLPCFMADPRLERLTEPKLMGDIWILMHPDMRRNPRIRLFRDEMLAAFKRLEPVMLGEAPPACFAR